MDWTNVTIAIPTSHLVNFHRDHADWLADAINAFFNDTATTETSTMPWGSATDDVARAQQVWANLSPRAKAMLSLFMAHPGQKFNATDLAEQLDIPNGMYGVAGVLAWPTRHAAKVERRIPVDFEYGALGEGASYWMTETTAEVFREAVNTPESR